MKYLKIKKGKGGEGKEEREEGRRERENRVESGVYEGMVGHTVMAFLPKT